MTVASSDDRDTVRRRYIAEHPNFTSAATASAALIETLLRQLGIRDAHVKVRAKDIASFVKKLRKYDANYWQSTTDKVGAQIVVHTLAEVRQLRAAFERGDTPFEYLETTDKSIYDGDPRKLRYTGVHIQTVVPGITTSNGERIECEIQLRTQAQDVWAYLEHGLIYKPVIEPSVQIARKVARLSVLVELFDEEVDSVMAQLQADPRYEPALLLQHAERLYLTFVTEPGETELSLEVLAMIAPTITADERSAYPDHLAEFVDSHRDQIEDILHEYGANSPSAGEYNYFLFTQPESLILWERIANRPRALVHSIQDSDLIGPVSALADVWGSPLSID